MKEKREASVGLMEEIIKVLCKAPESQVEKHIKDNCIRFNEKEHTPVEMYDFIQSISEQPMVKINEKMCIGDISSFVQVLCDMKRFYLRPND